MKTLQSKEVIYQIELTESELKIILHLMRQEYGANSNKLNAGGTLYREMLALQGD